MHTCAGGNEETVVDAQRQAPVLCVYGKRVPLAALRAQRFDARNHIKIDLFRVAYKSVH